MIVAVDIGSGSVRVGLIAPEGIMHVARRGGALALTPGRLTGIDLPVLRARVADALAEVAEVASASGARIETVTCTSIRYATVWSGGADDIAWANLARGDREDVAALQAGMSDADLLRLGGWPTPLSLASRLRSARRWNLEPPEDAVPLSVAGWLLCEWGAAAHVDEVTWADNRINAGELTREVTVVATGDTVGEYTGAVAGTEAWRGARLAVAPPDTVAALYGLGDLAVGDAVAIAGTTTPVVAVADDDAAAAVANADDHAWLPFRSGTLLAESNAARTGEVVAAMSRLVAPHESPLSAAGGDDDEHDLPPGGVRSFLGPTLVAPRWLGMPAAPQGIEFSVPFTHVRPHHLRRSAVEANAWATDVHLRRVEAQARVRGRRIVCGGQADSREFLELLAAAGGREVEAVSVEATLVGAAAAVSGQSIPPSPVRVVTPDRRIGDEPRQWAARWWSRQDNAVATGERDL